MMVTGYMIGRFDSREDWRERYKKEVPKVIWRDPRDNEQSSMGRLNDDDFGERGTYSDISCGHVDEGKNLGTTSYAEVGSATALGKPLVIVDENESKDSLLESASQYIFNSDKCAIEFLNWMPTKLIPARRAIKRKNGKGVSSGFESILFAGDLGGAENTINALSRSREVFTAHNVEDAWKYLPKTDLVVVNFEKGYNPIGTFFLGAANAVGINLISIDGNNVPYPPLTGLAKKVFLGDGRGENFTRYLINPRASIDHKQIVAMGPASKAALSREIVIKDKTLNEKDYESIYFSGNSESLYELKESMKGTKDVREEFLPDTDLLVAELSDDYDKNRTTLEDMFYAYEMKTPVLLIHGGDVASQDIVRLSRRPLFGPGRYKQAKEYLGKLKSQRINDEALVYYGIMSEFNSA